MYVTLHTAAASYAIQAPSQGAIHSMLLLVHRIASGYSIADQSCSRPLGTMIPGSQICYPG